MNRILSYILTFFFAGVFCVPAQAESNKLIVVTEHMPPYQIIASQKHEQQVDGYSIELIKHVLEIAQIEYEIMPMAWDRAYNFVQKKKNTLLLSMVRKPERENMFHLLLKINSINSNVWASANTTKRLNSLSEITTQVIAVNRNDHQHLLLRHYPNIAENNLLITSNKEQAIALVAKNRADYFLANEQILAWRLKAIGMQKQNFKKVLALKENINDLYIVANTDTSPQIINKLHHAYAELVSTKQLEMIKQRWF
jgi:polar amino acid transport system substrate-binding protein